MYVCVISCVSLVQTSDTQFTDTDMRYNTGRAGAIHTYIRLYETENILELILYYGRIEYSNKEL